MRFIGVDPGANYTGVAVLESDGHFSVHAEFGCPTDVWELICRECVKSHDPDDGTTVILEDFLGAGRRDNYVTTTIKIVGYIYWSCIGSAFSVQLVPNQARLPNVRNVPIEITGKDEIAAAAHALSARERWSR